MVLAKSDKNNGFCVAGVTKTGKFVRLVKDFEGSALNKEQCKFNKTDLLTVSVLPAPLVHQKENCVLSRIINQVKTNVTIKDLMVYTQNPEFIFSNTNPWLTEEEINNQKTSFLFVEVSELLIYENKEGKHKCDFIYNNNNYKGFSMTDPEFKFRNKRISEALIWVSLPNAPYNKYGNDLYYKFVCAVYPVKDSKKSHNIDCYKI